MEKHVPTAIAFFDFDGTITTDDSLIKFIRFVKGDARFWLGMLILSPLLMSYLMKLVPNYIAKQKMLAYFFEGYSANRFEQVAREYSLLHIDQIVRPQAMEKIRWHQKQGHRVVIVSASIDAWLRPWCEREGLELLATQLEISKGRISGRFLTTNCYGEEKVSRIRSTYHLSDYQRIYAYGDSLGDQPMLRLASDGLGFYKPFRM